jgi:hypothetical protein
MFSVLPLMSQGLYPNREVPKPGEERKATLCSLTASHFLRGWLVTFKGPAFVRVATGRFNS